MKLRSKIILSVLLVLIVVVATIFAILMPKEKSNVYSAYIDINPLIKLDFKVSCKNDKCEAPVVVGYEFINDDAKEIYKDLVIKDKPLKETIELLATTVKDNNITFKEVHIYTNYNNKDEFKINSVDYEIVLDVKESKELEQVVDELIIKKETIITKEIIVPIIYPKEVEEKKMFFQSMTEDCTFFKLTEYSELYVSRGRLKINISGPTELINDLPENTSIDDWEFYIKALVDVKDYSIGEHTTTLNITSQNSNVKILSPTSIRVNYEVLERAGSGHFCYKVE